MHHALRRCQSPGSRITQRSGDSQGPASNLGRNRPAMAGDLCGPLGEVCLGMGCEEVWRVIVGWDGNLSNLLMFFVHVFFPLRLEWIHLGGLTLGIRLGLGFWMLTWFSSYPLVAWEQLDLRSTEESWESPKSLNCLRVFPGTAMVIEAGIVHSCGDGTVWRNHDVLALDCLDNRQHLWTNKNSIIMEDYARNLLSFYQKGTKNKLSISSLYYWFCH